MSWHIERTGRMFVVRNELGREMFDGAFRNDIPEAMQARMLALIAAAPTMLRSLVAVDEWIEDLGPLTEAGTEPVAVFRGVKATIRIATET